MIPGRREGFRLPFQARVEIADSMKRPLKRYWLVGLVLLVGCARLASAQALTKIRVGKAQPQSFTFTPLDVAMQTGIFKKHGVEIEEYGFGGSARLQQGLAAGSIDLGLGSGPELAFIAKGAPVMGVAAMADAPGLLVLFVNQAGPIHSVADLKGKTVSVSTPGSLTEWMIHQLSRQQGWGTNGITTLPLGSDAAQISALKTHQIDGTIADVATAYKLEEEGSARIVVRFGSLVKDFHLHIIYASNAFIARDPGAIRSFLAGWFEAIAFMKANKMRTIEIVSPVMGVSPAIASKTYDEVMPIFNTTGRFNPKALEVLRQSYVDMGILPVAPEMSKLVTEKFLPNCTATKNERTCQ